MSEYDKGYAAGCAHTTREMAKAAFKIEKQLRNNIAKLQQTVDYLKSCVSCVDYNCQKKQCILQEGACVNLNKWRKPE